RQWYAKAQAAQPKDGDPLKVARQLAGFFLRTNQLAETEKQLEEIRRQGPPDMVAWARRSLALTFLAQGSYQKKRDALALFEPADGRAGPIEDPEDLRVLARVHESQATPEHRKRAIEILESLVARNLISSEDRFLLALLEDATGNWPRAREQFREL